MNGVSYRRLELTQAHEVDAAIMHLNQANITYCDGLTRAATANDDDESLWPGEYRLQLFGKECLRFFAMHLGIAFTIELQALS